jgi:hypothetical protein
MTPSSTSLLGFAKQGRGPTSSSSQRCGAMRTRRKPSKLFTSSQSAPTAIVASGTGNNVHAYWRLAEPVDPATAEELNGALAAALGADPVVRDAARILRLPGTFNHKHDPPTGVQLEHPDENPVDVDALRAVLPEVTNTSASTEDRTGTPQQVARVLAKLAEVRERGGSWMARCPAHDDRTPSLSVSAGDDGRCVVHCFRGCKPAAVVGSIGLTMGDPMPPRTPQASPSTTTRLLNLIRASHVARRAKGQLQ